MLRFAHNLLLISNKIDAQLRCGLHTSYYLLCHWSDTIGFIYTANLHTPCYLQMRTYRPGTLRLLWVLNQVYLRCDSHILLPNRDEIARTCIAITIGTRLRSVILKVTHILLSVR